MKTYTVNAFGRPHEVFCRKAEYSAGGLAILVYEEDPDYPGEPEPFGTLTVRMDGPAPGYPEAFVKTWSENEGWALELARLLGARPTGVHGYNGYVSAPLYAFDPDVLAQMDED